ncbi:MAG TPA: phosphoribosyltransferase family protein [Afifellaceae bacterium]|nr:phosphoribosyltransferase family protein [Afifellaceae bacterium]
MPLTLFRDRSEAGRLLAEKLLAYKDRSPLVLALPRGGVPVALEIAKALEAPLDIVLVRKIGAPFRPELALGAVVEGPQAEVFVNRDIATALAVSEDYIEREASRQLEEIERRRALYLGDSLPVTLTGRTVIVVDDGIATGATARVALRAARRGGAAAVILAAPVAPPESAEELGRECDATVFLDTPADFGAVGFYYADFAQLSDEDVRRLLADAPKAD